MMCKGLETSPAAVLEQADQPAHGGHCTDCHVTAVVSEEWGRCAAHFVVNPVRCRVDVWLVCQDGAVRSVRHSSQLWVDAVDARLCGLMQALPDRKCA